VSETPEQTFLNRAKACEEKNPGYFEKWVTFRGNVLEHGGEDVVHVFGPDPHLDLLLTQGGIVGDDLKRTFKRGEPSGCHGNAVRLYLTGKADFITTGYALSEDGLWRQHTWANTKTKLIETTVQRTMYYGVTLEGVRLATFVASNLREDDLRDILENRGEKNIKQSEDRLLALMETLRAKPQSV
jgi:hypothetical protein